jgi:hypothetical protein
MEREEEHHHDNQEEENKGFVEEPRRCLIVSKKDVRAVETLPSQD